MCALAKQSYNTSKCKAARPSTTCLRVLRPAHATKPVGSMRAVPGAMLNRRPNAGDRQTANSPFRA
jgi:hypothetical protein